MSIVRTDSVTVLTLLAGLGVVWELVSPKPRWRKTIAQRFNAGFPGGGGTSPVRDERKTAARGDADLFDFRW